MPELGPEFRKLRNIRFSLWWVLAVAALLWLASGLYIVDADEIGVVKRFGKYDRQTESGLHYHLPFPVEKAQVPKVTQIRRAEVGFRSLGRDQAQQQQYRLVPEESLMLTGDENIVDVQFIVQYLIKDPVAFLFRVREPDESVKSAAEAAIRGVVGTNQIGRAHV